MYELFEHTADLGLRVSAADLDTLFAEAAACLFSGVLEDIDSVRPEQSVTVELAGTDRAGDAARGSWVARAGTVGLAADAGRQRDRRRHGAPARRRLGGRLVGAGQQ